MIGPLLLAAFLLVPVQERTAVRAGEGTTRALLRADELLRAGRAGQAREVLEDLLRGAPTQAEAHRMLGHALLELDRESEARRSFVRALELGHWSPDVLAALADMDRAAGLGNGSLPALALLAWLWPDESDGLLALGQVLTEAGMDAPARAVLEELLARDPGRSAAWRVLGMVHERSGAEREAVLCLATALRLGPPDAALAHGLAALEVRRGSPRRAARWLREALTNGGTGDAQLRLQLARLELEAGSTASARRELTSLPEELRQGAEALVLLGHVALREGRTDEATSAWEQAVAVGARQQDVLAFLLRAALERRDAQLVARWLPLLGAPPDRPDPAITRLLVAAHLELGQDVEALAVLQGHVSRAGLDELARELLRQVHAVRD